MRLIVIALLIYLLYKVTKPWITPSGGTTGHTGQDDRGAGDLDDVMVKDPYCEVYFPKRTGIHLKFRGEDLYFCSENCRDQFLASHEKQH